MAGRLTRRSVRFLTAALVIVLSAAALDAVRAGCAEEAKSARTSGEKVHLRLRCDQSLYSNVKYSVDARVLSLKNRPDGTTEVTFGRMSSSHRTMEPEDNPGPQKPFVPEEKSFPGTATLLWRDKDRPLPLAVGMSIFLGLDSQKMVRAFTYSISRLVAVRKRTDGFWEELIQVSKDNHPRQPLLILFANHTDLGGPDEDGGETDIEWNETLGLCKGYWSGCGGGEAEKEGISSELHGHGWAPVNSQLRIRPGRDGWIRFDKLEWIKKNGGKDLVPPSQFLKDSC